MNHFRLMVARYMDRLDRLNIPESFFGPGGQELTLLNRLKALGFLVLGFPIFLWGLLHNYLPYKFLRWITGKMQTFKSQIAPMKMLAGIPVFILYYMIILSCVQWYFGVTAITVL